MSTFAADFLSHVGSTRHYANNVGSAVRALFAALFAVKPAVVKEAVLPQAAVATKVVRQKSILELYYMASRTDSVMPNLSAELRVMAREAS